MRYYKISITKPNGGALVREYTSQVNGANDPGALNVEMDIPVTAFDTPTGAAYVRVWGISLRDIGQASNLNNNLISVFGGMAKGLPLANPKQSGLLTKGYVQQAFGNWIGTDMTLDLIIGPGEGPNGVGQNNAPKNIVMNWQPGTQMSAAIGNALSTAFPGVKQNINISKNLVLPNHEPGPYPTLEQFSHYVRGISKSINKDPNYTGVSITMVNNEFQISDATISGAFPSGVTTKMIAFTDLVGQPTWIENRLIQTTCVMRADLKVTDVMKLPPTLATTTAASLSQYRDSSIFQGTFQIQALRHVGNFRQPDARAWATTIDAYPMGSSSSATGPTSSPAGGIGHA